MKTIHRHSERHQLTLAFLKKHMATQSKILDLGTPTDLSKLINENGFVLQNTKGENLDTDYQAYLDTRVDIVTAFEIFEHMLAPFNILKDLKTDKLIASVPLNLWFASAYWGADEWDKHYHEFEKKQFDFLLEQTGWKIKDSEMWSSHKNKIGIRPLLRRFYPRYYIVYCER
jgi:hypothetical protein